MKLDDYRLLGRSGLRVSPLSLGAMTFGTDWGWGADETESRRIFDAYVDRGGNFIDTASVYTNGSSERLVGAFAKEKRNRLVIATKFTCASVKGDANSGGNQRKNMLQTVEQSLKRMALESIDLLYLHAWDGTTPVEEVMRAFDDLVSAGKVHYIGISDTPAWQVARMQTLADLRGWAPFVALQVEYSLVQRTVERDLLPMARELGLGVTPWSPLASGVLTGKYSSRDLGQPAEASEKGTRRNIAAGNGSLTERSLGIAETVKSVAAELGHSPAQVAIAWTLQHSAVTSPILGARTVGQLEENLGALEVTLPAEHLQRLASASAIELGFPHDFLQLPLTREVIFGGASIRARSQY
jgi:aryl-alcohol dehydrogenase-like predicted oxidoreductase